MEKMKNFTKRNRNDTIDSYDQYDRIINKDNEIIEFIDTVIRDLEEFDFQSLKIKYFSFFEYLKNYTTLPILDDLKKQKTDTTQLTRKQKNESQKENPFLNSIFLYPQFKMNYLNFDENVYKGRIMVHDLTHFFEEGLTEKRRIYGRISMNQGQKLFAISCDERMNFANSLRNQDSRNNKTKQLY